MAEGSTNSAGNAGSIPAVPTDPKFWYEHPAWHWAMLATPIVCKMLFDYSQSPVGVILAQKLVAWLIGDCK
jgi:hypothetical protein